jgi:metallo-beta-lactamase class B
MIARITDDYRRTHHKRDMLEPSIWLAQHNEYYDLEVKRAWAGPEGVDAWIDPRGIPALGGKQEARVRGPARQGDGDSSRAR